MFLYKILGILDHCDVMELTPAIGRSISEMVISLDFDVYPFIYYTW